MSALIRRVLLDYLLALELGLEIGAGFIPLFRNALNDLHISWGWDVRGWILVCGDDLTIGLGWVESENTNIIEGNLLT